MNKFARLLKESLNLCDKGQEGSQGGADDGIYIHQQKLFFHVGI
jgi:hypothetical protein